MAQAHGSRVVAAGANLNRLPDATGKDGDAATGQR